MRGGHFLHRFAVWSAFWVVPFGRLATFRGKIDFAERLVRFVGALFCDDVHAARNAVDSSGAWGATGEYLVFLLAAMAVTSLFATWCFRSYQRSI